MASLLGASLIFIIYIMVYKFIFMECLVKKRPKGFSDTRVKKASTGITVTVSTGQDICSLLVLSCQENKESEDPKRQTNSITLTLDRDLMF